MELQTKEFVDFMKYLGVTVTPTFKTTLHYFKKRHRSFRLLRRKAPYSVGLPKPWNIPPEHNVNAPSIGTFRRLLDVAWPSLIPNQRNAKLQSERHPWGVTAKSKNA